MKKEMVAQLFMYDTLMGTFKGNVTADDSFLYIDDKKIKLVATIDARTLPWKKENIDFVVDCTGAFTHREKAKQHLESGASHVLISAPSKDEDIAIIPGVNMDNYNKNKHRIISLGSCTTNALLPLLFVLNNTFGIQDAYMNTIHAYTNSQVLLDVQHHDARRARAAALNIIPTSSGATEMIDTIIPALKGKVSGISLRVPVAKVSIIDLSFTTKQSLSVDVIHATFEKNIQHGMSGIIAMTNTPLVSSDFSGNSHSAIIDMPLTKVQGEIGKVFAWYDNEWGYSVRLKDFLIHAAK